MDLLLVSILPALSDDIGIYISPLPIDLVCHQVDADFGLVFTSEHKVVSACI